MYDKMRVIPAHIQMLNSFLHTCILIMKYTMQLLNQMLCKSFII